MVKRSNIDRKTRDETVYPIVNNHDLQRVKSALEHNFGQSGTRNLTMFQFAKGTFSRASDMVNLRLDEVFDLNDNVVYDEVVHIDQKTGKRRVIHLDWINGLQQELLAYIQWRNLYLLEHHQQSDWLFFNMYHPDAPVTVNAFNKILKRAQHMTGIKLSTHVCRKTAAYRVYMQNDHDVALVMHLLNHSSQQATLHYLGLDDQANGMKLRKTDLG